MMSALEGAKKQTKVMMCCVGVTVTRKGEGIKLFEMFVEI